MKVLLLVLFLIMALSACTTAPKAEQWPSNMPPIAFFKDYYAKDEPHQESLTEQQYLTWVYRFYAGWELYGRGWVQATNELEDSLVLPEDRKKGREMMENVGRLIAPDWAKSDPYRTINIRHVALWGNLVLESMVNDTQLRFLEQLTQDVNQLLAGELDPKVIKRSRYTDSDDTFGSRFADDF